MNPHEVLEFKRIERITDLLKIPPSKRTERNILEIMSFTKVIILFFIFYI